MQDLIPFDFQGNALRVVLVDDEPWFALADVCQHLEIGNSRAVAARLDAEVKGVTTIDTLGGPQPMTIISEPGLYEVISTSRSPKAKPFKRWLFSEVLPTIRKTGGYGQVQQLSGPALYLAAIEQAQGEIQALEARARVLEPKAEAFDDFLSAEGDYSINAASKLLQRRGFKTGQNRLANLLLDWGWLYRGEKKNLRASQAQLNCNRLAENTFYYIDRVTGEKKTGRTQVRITPKGVDAIASRMEVDQTLSESEAV